MADQMDRFYELLSKQSDTLVAQGQSLACIAQAQQDMKERLFGAGGTPGLIPHLANEHKELGTKQELLAAAIGKMSSDSRAEKAYVLGGAAVLSLFVKAVLNKIGLHF